MTTPESPHLNLLWPQYRVESERDSLKMQLMVAQHKLQDSERRAESYRVDIQVIQKQMEALHKRALVAEHRAMGLELEVSIHVD